MANISLDLDKDAVTVIIEANGYKTSCDIDPDGARALAKALIMAATIIRRRIEKGENKPSLRLVED